MRSLTVFMALFAVLFGVKKAHALTTIPVPVECPTPALTSYTTVRGDHLNGTDGVLARFGTTLDELRGANPGVLVPVARFSVAPGIGSPYQATSVTVAVSHLRWYLPPGKALTIPASRASLEAAARCERNRVARLERVLQSVRAERDDARRQLTQARDETASVRLQRAFDQRDYRRNRAILAAAAAGGLLIIFGVGWALGRRRRAVPDASAVAAAVGALDASRADELDSRAHRLGRKERKLEARVRELDERERLILEGERELYVRTELLARRESAVTSLPRPPAEEEADEYDNTGELDSAARAAVARAGSPPEPSQPFPRLVPSPVAAGPPASDDGELDDRPTTEPPRRATN